MNHNDTPANPYPVQVTLNISYYDQNTDDPMGPNYLDVTLVDEVETKYTCDTPDELSTTLAMAEQWLQDKPLHGEPGEWYDLADHEVYVTSRTNASFARGICRTMLKREQKNDTV